MKHQKNEGHDPTRSSKIVALMTDEELVDFVCRGETRHFEELVRRHQDAVYSMASRYASAAGDVEDIAQEVFLRAFRSIGSFRREAKFSTWLYRITYNMCVDWARKKRSRPSLPLEEGGDVADRRTDVEAEVLAGQEREEVQRAAGELEERYRSVIMMYYYEELSYEDIASVLGIRPKTVETRLYRARKALRRALERRWGRSSS